MPSIINSDFESLPESYQEYIVTIYRLSSKTKKVTNIDISNKMGNAPSSVYNMLKKLASRKLIQWEPKQKEILLTTKGKRIAKQLILSHLIMELFLREYLGLIDDDQIHNLACKLEHHVTEPIKQGFRRKIGEEAYKNLEVIVEMESDPESTIKRLKEVFPSPKQVVSRFARKLKKLMPESEERIEIIKTEFLENL
ncbi:MAG: metal-dependent transcriptional regulator [Candidatus Lokiarchaeota archaeon]|nr:metal-dependent transcriptional regulator [Candidatus Lokiarchaeota archaeon]